MFGETDHLRRLPGVALGIQVHKYHPIWTLNPKLWTLEPIDITYIELFGSKG